MTYLNVAGLSPFTKAVQHEVTTTLEQFSKILYSDKGIHFYREKVQHGRKTLARWLQISNEERIAFVPNATTANWLALSRIQWKPGDNVLTTTHENSTVLKEISCLHTRGIQVHRLDPTSPDELEFQIVELLESARVRAIVLSHVSHIDGRILPIERIYRLAQQYRVLLIVDGAQAVGHIPVSFQEWQPDAYFFPGHKWCAGPMGTGAMILGERFLKSAAIIQPEADEHQPPWGDFELGTQNIGLIAGITKAVLIKEQDGLHTAKQIDIRQEFRHEISKMAPFKMLEWNGPHSPGIFSLTCTNEQTEEQLQSKEHAISWKTFTLPQNPGKIGIRLSWSSLTSQTELDTALHLLKTIH